MLLTPKKILVFPLTLLFEVIVRLRNLFFDWGLFNSKASLLPSILVGNITVGGTGKSPHVQFLVGLFADLSQIAVLSRGYGRKTKGFLEVSKNTSARQVGDEPKALFQRFSEKLSVFVCENRLIGEAEICKIYPQKQLLLLDDGFQHRAIKADVNIVLVDYNQNIFEDILLPAGRLREPIGGLNRAQIVVVTKCPKDFLEEKSDEIKHKLLVINPSLSVYFTETVYGDYINFENLKVEISKSKPILAIAGLAQPKPFFEYLFSQFEKVETLAFPDHHSFVEADIIKMKDYLQKGYQVICTEKDFVKLKEQFLDSDKICYLPITIRFLYNELPTFKKMLQNNMAKNNRKLINFEGEN